MHNPEHALTREDAQALFTEARNFDAATGDDFEVSCNAEPRDHVHARRVGLVGNPKARVAVSTHQGPAGAAVFIHPSEARALAAALLNIADEIDGKTPLVFFPRPIAEEDLDNPAADV